MGYRSFFSYARADDRVANWLHRQIDSYRTPKALVGASGAFGPVPAKLHPIFRDRTDLRAGGHIDQSLQEALEASETLIVLCSPTAAKSQWVDHECRTFLGLRRADRIFPVIAAGEPDSGDPETECLPAPLRGLGLLAADLREIRRPSGHLVGDGKQAGRLKLIAGLLGIPLDALMRRERRRQQALTFGFAAAAIVFAGLAAAATVLAFTSLSAMTWIEQRERRLIATEFRRLENSYAEGGISYLDQQITERVAASDDPFCYALAHSDGTVLVGDLSMLPMVPASDRSEWIEYALEAPEGRIVVRGFIARLLGGPILLVTSCEPAPPLFNEYMLLRNFQALLPAAGSD